jgi:ribosomal protein S2
MEAEKYLFRYMDKKKIAAFYGFLRYRRRIPGLGFFPTYFDNVHAIEEFVLSSIISIGIVDSNVTSGDVFIPLPSNDDS